MTVGIDDAGDDVFASEIDNGRASGHACVRPKRANAAVLDDHGDIRLRRAAGAVNQGGVGERGELRLRAAGAYDRSSESGDENTTAKLSWAHRRPAVLHLYGFCCRQIYQNGFTGVRRRLVFRARLQ